MPQKNNHAVDYDPLTDRPPGYDPSEAPQLPPAGEPQVPAGKHQLDLKSPLIRIITTIVTVAMILGVVLLFKNLFLPKNLVKGSQSAAVAALPTVPPNLKVGTGGGAGESADFAGIPRLAQLHTIIPERPRTDIVEYTVQEGDTVFGIAEKFGLKPETILWGNYYTLLDNPSFLQPGQVLNILPIDGIYHRWNAGDGLNGVAYFFNVTPEDIINYPLNHLSMETIGDLSHPNIAPGTMLVIPNGKRSFVTWSAPRITRDDPGVAKVLGPGFCGTVTDGPVGVEAFVWPTNNHFLSGFDYSPQTNHFGIDLDGETGDPIYAADNGVVVYSGWNDWGYGNMIVLDHGNGWQTLYAHLSQINVACGDWVYQGSVIGLMGSTGRSSGSHLHFEMMNDTSGKVNPFAYLP
jgi:hypothetical protein